MNLVWSGVWTLQAWRYAFRKQARPLAKIYALRRAQSRKRNPLLAGWEKATVGDVRAGMLVYPNRPKS